MRRSSFAAALAVTAHLLPSAPAATAAELQVICSNALQSSLLELVPQFERESGHKLVVNYGTTGPLKVRIEKGEVFDLAILGPDAIDDLIKQGRLVAATRVDLARSGIGVAVRKGAPKPNLDSVEAFRRALLDAKSIAYNDAGLTGSHLKGLFQLLGIADDLKPKTRNGRGAEMVAKGEAEIGITQVSEILPVAGVELAGPLPSQVQLYSVFPAAVASASQQAAAAKDLLRFFATPDAARVMRSHGLDPPA
jgi:molybdate transport system substrate-binding protein